MNFKIETEGGIVFPLPKSFTGVSTDLSAEHADALNQLYNQAEKFNQPNPETGADQQKYSLEVQKDDQTKEFTFHDSDLKNLPQNISDLLTHLSNKAKFS